MSQLHTFSRSVFTWILAVSLPFAFAGEPFSDLYKPTDISVHPNGNLYIADSGNQRIVILNKKGEYIADFGREGLGPGEFQRPCGVGFLSSDEILVADNRTNKIQVFDQKGQYQRVFLKGDQGTGQVWVLPNDLVVVTSSDGQYFTFSAGDKENPPPLRLYSKQGESAKGLGAIFKHEIPLVFALLNHGSIAFHGNRIAFARVGENLLEVFENDTATEYRYAPAFPSEKPDGEMKQVKQPDGSTSISMYSKSEAHCLDLAAIDGSHLLMLRAKSPETDGIVPTQLVVLGWDGTLIKKLPGTYRAKNMAIGHDGKHVFLIDENDDGWFVKTVPLAL